MKLMALALLFLFSADCDAQSVAKENVPFTERFCGKLVHSLEAPTKKDQVLPLPRKNIRLYRAEGSGKCCSGLTPVAHTTAGRRGSFQLVGKNVRPGSYWVAVEVDGRDYKLLVRYQQPDEPDTLCDRREWAIDN